MFSFLDWTVVLLYFVCMSGIGIYFSNRNKDFKDFIFGGGQMPWLAVGISLIATSVSATTFLGNPADAFATDMRLLQLTGGSILAIFVIGKVFIPRLRRAGIHSAYELLEIQFSRPVRLLAASLYCCHLVLRTGLLLYVPSLVLMPILGVPMWASILIMSLVSILYTYHGGIKAVTWTDVIQFLIFTLAGLGSLWYIAQQVGSFSETWQLAAAAGKTRWLDFTFDPASDRNFWNAVLVYSVFELAIRGCDQQFVQRYLSCRNEREANLSSLSSVFLGVVVSWIFFSVGAFLWVFYQSKHLAPLPALGVNEVFPHFILNTLPSGARGLLVAAILAAAMSSQSSALTALSNTTVVDFLTRRNPGEMHSIHSAKKWVLIWGLLGMLAAFFCALGDVSILKKALFFTSLFIGPLLALFLLGFFRSHLHPKAVFLSAFCGMFVLMLFLDIPILPKGMWTPLYKVSWPWNPFIAMLATVFFAHLLPPFFRKAPV